MRLLKSFKNGFKKKINQPIKWSYFKEVEH